MQLGTTTDTYKSAIEVALGIAIIDSIESQNKPGDEDSDFRICLLKENEEEKFSIPIREVTEKINCLETLETMIYDWVILPPDVGKTVTLQDVLEIEISGELEKKKERKIVLVYTLYITNGNHHILEDRLVPLTLSEFTEVLFSTKEQKFKTNHHQIATAAFVRENHGRRQF